MLNLKSINPNEPATMVQLPCAHQPGQSVLVCMAGHTNLMGTVEAVTFTSDGQVNYDLLTDISGDEPVLLKGIRSWRVAAVPEGYNGAPVAASDSTVKRIV